MGARDPTGVADNGGLVASSGHGRRRPRLAGGFEPSQDLAFSPLALSTNRGASWSPGLAPRRSRRACPTPRLPSAGAGSARPASGPVGVRSCAAAPAICSAWSKLVGRADASASSAAGRSCGVGALTAVAFDATGGLWWGRRAVARASSVSSARPAGRWRLGRAAPVGRRRRPTTKVLRLVDVGDVTSGLVAVGRPIGPSLIGVASAAGGGWSRSPLRSPWAGAVDIVSTGVEPGGGFVVLASRAARITGARHRDRARRRVAGTARPAARHGGGGGGADGVVDALSDGLDASSPTGGSTRRPARGARSGP